MKFRIYSTLLACTAVGISALSSEPVTIAGWDFSQFTFGGDNSIGDSWPDYSEAGALNANYSALLDSLDPGHAGGPLASGFGTIYYNGMFASTPVSALEQFGGSEVDGFDGQLNSLSNATDLAFNSNAAFNGLGINGQSIRNQMVLRVQADVSIVFEAMANEPSSNWQLSFAHQSPGAAGQAIDWSYSTDGAAYENAGVSVNVTQQDAGDIIDFGSGLDGATSVYLKARFTGATEANPVYIDNVSIAAEPGGLSDPSWWAASSKTAEGWRYSGEGYPGEPGIGWIFDEPWPWIYALSQGNPSDGDWIYIFEDSGDRNNFWGFNKDQDFWFLGVSSFGWYYSFKEGDEGWKKFNL